MDADGFGRRQMRARRRPQGRCEHGQNEANDGEAHLALYSSAQVDAPSPCTEMDGVGVGMEAASSSAGHWIIS